MMWLTKQFPYLATGVRIALIIAIVWAAVGLPISPVSAAPGILLGVQTIGPMSDYNPAGTAEAFQYTATSSGTANRIHLYVDGASTGTQVRVGLYSNAVGNVPGTLLTSGIINNPIGDAWNTVTVPSTTVTAGNSYWIAVLGPVGAGTIRFRDVSVGNKAQTSGQTNLTSLPASWTAGTDYQNSPLSAYVEEFGQVVTYTLMVHIVGSGSVTRNPNLANYDAGTSVQLTAVPQSGYTFSGWSGDLTGSTNPANLIMNSNKVVTATFGAPTPQHGICEGFETGYTLGQTIGAHADWYDAGAGPAVTAGVGVTGSNGLGAANDIFTWVAHPFSWNDPDLTEANFQMDFKTDASGQFDDDRIGWMITSTSAASTEFFGVQLDHPDGGIVTFWRDTAGTRIQTPIVPLTGTTATKANTWYRFQAQIAKLTSISAKIDVALTELDAAGNPIGTPVTGSVPNTSLWAGGAPASRYFTASTMWPAYKNYTTAASNADNACFNQVERFAFVVTTDWHTSDVWPNATVAGNLQQIHNWIVTPTLDMPAPAFMIVNGDFPNWDQTQSSIDTVLGTGFPWYPVIGNHEVEDNLNNFNTIRDTLVPALPNIVNYGPAGSLNTSYSWDYSNAHFVSLNGYWDGTTNSGADHAADGNIVPALNTWLNADLTASGQVHQFAFVHEPAFPANRHVGDSLDKYPANRDAFIATLNAHDVETVFSGHTHFYEHDVAPEFPLGDLHQITNGYLRAYDGATITYVLVNGDCTTYKVYRRLTSAPFALHETWSIGCSAPTQYTLTTTALSNGSITRNPDQAQYNDGAIVQLTAVPQSGYVFNGWSGDLTGSANPTTVTMNGNKVVTATFATAPPAGPVLRFAAVGDYGDASTNEQNVANLINTWNPEFVITMGDNSYGSTSPLAPALSTIDHNIGRYYRGYIGAYTGGFGSGSAPNRFFPTIGNHDYTDGGGINAYLNYFTLPGAGITTTNTSGNERYYDFVQGPVHFFAINSDTTEPNGTSSSSTQAQWLQTRLAASTAPWKIVYFHHPPYSSGNVHGSSAWMQWPFQQWGADAVLAGHDHTYERIILNGFPYFVNGAGGHGLYSFTTPVTGSEVRYSTTYGAMLIEATSITMTFKFYSIAGGSTLVDSYTITTAAPTDNNLVTAGSTWKYLDNGSNQGTAWRASAFDDSGWASGAAPLGYGDAMTTTVNCGPNAPTCTSSNYITTYFRQSFNVTDPSAFSGLNLRLRRDDGAVVYLNGTEVWRSNMPAGAVSYTTLAPVAVGGADETTFFTTTLPNTLITGANVLAVEIHQQAATSSDIGFDLILTGTLATPAPASWIAYNDFNGIAGDSNAANVTRYPYTTTGVLKDYTTGVNLTAVLSGTTSGGYDPQPATNGGPANVGTDSANTFGATGSIIVDQARTIELDATTWSNIATFTNLDPTKAYTVALTANRNEPTYANARYTRVTIEGADSYTNASTSGVVVYSPDSVSFSTGYNTVNGYVARWTNVRPGTDGSFSVRSQWDDTQGSGTNNIKGYAMSAVKLQQGEVSGPEYTLTTNTVGSGTISRTPSAASYAPGTIVTLTAIPDSGYVFSGWSGDLSGSANPATITMTSNRVVTATFVPGACVPFTENFNNLTLGTRIGQVPGWTESASASPAVVAGGLAGTQGLGTGSSIFNWSAHPFTWTNPALNTVTFQMDFQTNASGAFDDDRLAWMTENTPGSSQYNFGIQLDPDTEGAICSSGQNIETYWRNPAFGTNTADRIETTIACLPTLTASGWYRAQLLVTKLTNTSARLDVTLTTLDGSGNPGAVVSSGTVTDTSTWPGGAAPAAYFSPSGTSTALYPSYKNHNGTTGNADNASANLCPVQYALTVNTIGSGAVTKNPNQVQYEAGSVVTLTAEPASGYVFGSWSGDLNGSTNPATITLDGNKVVTATFLAVVTRTLGAGWNLLALPLQPQPALTAQALLDSLNAQSTPGNCTDVNRWLSDGWDTYSNGWGFNNFAIVPGQSYFVICATPFTWQLLGQALSAGVPVALAPGWNLLSVPYPTTGYQAQSLLDAVAADGGICSDVNRWFFDGWDTYSNGWGFNNFSILPDQGYFLSCSNTSTFTP